jgi:hypothetical protein
MTINYRIPIGILAIALGLGFVLFWPGSGNKLATEAVANLATEAVAVSRAPAPATISIWEMHNLAHLENLPVQSFEDQSVIFAQARR